MSTQGTNPLRVLMVEDSQDDAFLVKRQLESAGYRVVLGRVDTEEALIAALKSEPWDIVFSDFSMPRFDGIQALRVVREHDIDLPFIVVSGTIGEERAVMLMKHGAQDYLLKGNVKRLIPAVEREIREAKVRREHRLAQEHIRRLAYYDPLTQLPNRQRLVEDLQQQTPGPNRLALLIVNLINFREINESIGYTKGDALIREVAARLQDPNLHRDGLYHLHGNEFAIVMRTDDRSEIDEYAQTIHKVLAPHYTSEGFRVRIAARIGIAVSAASEVSSLVQRAGMAVALARRNAKPLAWYEIEGDPANPQSLALLADLHDAIGTDQLFLVFQPKVQCDNSGVTGCEALLRWRHPDRGMIAPDVFIHMAERSGLIDDIATHVISCASAQIKRWRKQGIVRPVAVNLSPKNLLNGQVVNDILQIATAGDSGQSELEIEITETALMQDPAQAIDVLRRLYKAGVRIYIDDFGTGFSSLSYLTQLPIHAIKIDKSFVIDLDQRSEADTIVRSTINLAHNLKLKVIAEGVETSATWNRLIDYRCDEAQGFYFAKPLPAHDYENQFGAWDKP